MRIFDSKPALRWLAPLALVLAVSGTGLVAATASADNSLPPTSPEKLLADVQRAKVDGLSGTVVQQADLGIPAIPGAGGGDDTQLTSLISGNHTLRVVYAGPDKSRLAVQGTFGETDVFRNGSDLWNWSSNDNSVTHRTLTADEQKASTTTPADVPKTPEEAAQQVLNALTPTTTVTTDSAVKVAGRDAYDLVLDPNDSASLIKQVRIAVDGETKLPLQVVVYGRDNQVALKVGYTDVSFARPNDSEFAFKAPPGAKVTEAPAVVQKAPSKADRTQAQTKADQAKADTKMVGKGWTTVVVTKVPSGSTQAGQLKAFTDKLTEVSGTWGKGRLLAGTAFSALLTDDGRLAVGAVEPSALYAALG